MHIPDGYLSPATCAVFYGVMAPMWYLSSKKASAALGVKGLPLMALGAAFTFVIQMFNFPIPGGSSGHMAGGAVLGIALGPWAAVMAMSLTLGLQALIFGDGGLLSFAANCFNMAVVMPLAGYFIFSLFTVGSPGRGRRFFAAAAAAYVAVNLAAALAGLELGLQPLIAHAADGRALYAPYPLHIALPAMALPHLFFFGVVEALGTSLAVSYAVKMGLIDAGQKASYRPLFVFLALLIALVPLGLIATGTPWGEWGKEELGSLLGYVPSGMEKFEGAWKGLLPDYGQGSESGDVFSYVVSAFIGSALVVGVVYLWGRLWKR